MSMRHVNNDMVLSFDTPLDRWRSEQILLYMMTILTLRNFWFLLDNPDFPKLYDSGMVYMLPEQLERKPSKSQMDDLAKFLKVRMRMGSSEAQHHLDLARGVEIFRDIPRMMEHGGGDCFPLSQKIIVRSLSTGLYELLALGELRHVYPSYEVLSYNFKKSRYEFKAITRFIDKGVKPVSCAHLSNGTDLVATDDHKFWTLNGSRRSGMELGVRTMGEYVEAMKMSKGARAERSRIVQAARIPILSAVRPSSSAAYLAGIYAAEGNFDGKHTAIAQHKVKVRAKIEMALAEVGTGFRYRQGGRGGKTTPGSGAYYALHGGAANPIVAMMREQGLTSFDKMLPQAFLSGDEETLSRMVEGHGDGDAWRPGTTKYKRTKYQQNDDVKAIYATSSDVLMEQLRFALLQLGKPTYAYQYSNHQGQGTKPIWRLHEYGAQEGTRLGNRRTLVESDLKGLTYSTVRHAEAAGEAHVGCITVEDNHNFFLADGTLVSNCDNWASARAAEIAVAAYRIGGKSGAKPYLVWHEDGDRMIYHAKVMHGDGSDEDPSIIQGMGGTDRRVDRLEECRKNYERYDNLWQAAKRVLAEEDFSSEDERVSRASEMKAAIDGFGYLPKDGVFRVGSTRAQTTAMVGYDRSKTGMLGLDLLGVRK